MGDGFIESSAKPVYGVQLRGECEPQVCSLARMAIPQVYRARKLVSKSLKARARESVYVADIDMLTP